MRIDRIIWYRKFVEKFWDRHRVEVHEAEEALKSHKRVRRAQRGHVEGEDVYLALGQTDAGHYPSVFFAHKKSHDAIVISARDMDAGERREYGKT
jgi:uncharacterized DUF497 family protein